MKTKSPRLYFAAAVLGLCLAVNARAAEVVLTAQGRASFTNLTLAGVAFGNDRYVAIGSSDDAPRWTGMIGISTNGNDWTYYSLGLANVAARLTSIASDGLRFVVTSQIGATNAMLASQNGIDWTVKGWLSGPSPTSIFYGGGYFMAAGNEARLLTSPDGCFWTAQLGPDSMFFYSGGDYANGRWLALAGGGLQVSLNGLDWSYVPLFSPDPSDYSFYISAVTHGQGHFLLSAQKNAGTLFYGSADGFSWRESGHILPKTRVNLLHYGNGVFVAHRADGLVMTSTNGTDWASGCAFSAAPRAITFGQGRFVAVGDGAFLSTNGIEWFRAGVPLQAPLLSSAPVTNSVFWGGSAVLAAPVLAANPLPVCLWMQDGRWVDLPPLQKVELSNVTSAQAGDYQVVVSNRFGVQTSAPLRLQVELARPVFKVQPPNLSCLVGENIWLESYAEGYPEPAYQWFFNALPLTNATLRTFWTLVTNLAQGGAYFAVASNQAGTATSHVATVQVRESPPTFIAQPVDLHARAGDYTSFYPQLNLPASCQWYFNNQPLPDATNRQLNFYPAMPIQAGTYFLVASNYVGAVTSLVVQLSVTLQPPVLGGIDGNLTNWVVLEGAAANFPLTVYGAPSPAGFLLRDGTNVSYPPDFLATTNPMPDYQLVGYRIPEARLDDAGAYSVLATNLAGVTNSPAFSLTVVPAGPLDRWGRRNPLPQVNHLYAIAYGNGQFVAVGERGAILTSPNAREWQVQPLRADFTLNDLCFANGLFVAVGDSGSVMTSSDGVHWSVRATKPGSPLSAVAFGNGLFAAAGPFYPGVLTSRDGLAWERHDSAQNSLIDSLAFGNDQFLAVDRMNQLRTSPDGVHWSSPLFNFPGDPDRAAYLNGHFIVVGDQGMIMTSTDAVTWQAANTPTTRRLLAVAYGNGRYVAVGTRGAILVSADASVWNQPNSPTPDRLERVTFADGQFVAVGENGSTLTSPDGLKWSRLNRGTVRDLDGMTFGNGLIVVVGKNGTVLTSADGVQYTEQSTGVTNDIHGVHYASGRFVAVGEHGLVLSSVDGTNWSQRPTLSVSSLKRVTRGPDAWLAVGTQGAVLRSVDGITWDAQFAGTFQDLNDAAWGQGRFVAVGDQDRNPFCLRTSTDGRQWDSLDYPTFKNVRAITFAAGMFLAAGNDGLLLESTNGLNWTAIPFPIYRDYANLRSVSYADGCWIITANQGAVWTSFDRRSWIQHYPSTRENLHAAVTVDNTWVVIGNRGNILQSGPFNAIHFRVLGFDPVNGFKYGLVGAVGRSFRLQTSADLLHWSDLWQTTNAPLTDYHWDNDATTQPQKFYRLVSP